MSSLKMSFSLNSQRDNSRSWLNFFTPTFLNRTHSKVLIPEYLTKHILKNICKKIVYQQEKQTFFAVTKHQSKNCLKPVVGGTWKDEIKGNKKRKQQNGWQKKSFLFFFILIHNRTSLRVARLIHRWCSNIYLYKLVKVSSKL